MRDIRARIAQRHGIELSAQQIEELAARRLEAVLDPRAINPTLMQQLRRDAATAPVALAAPDAGYSFEDDTLYESHRGPLRLIRRMLNPILKLFFNPNPLVHALQAQARINREAAARDAERDRLQAEWNALHYEILQRTVTEVSRASLELQSLALRVESLAARIDFNDRRVRSLETMPAQTQGRPARPVDQPGAAGQAGAADSAASEGTAGESTPADGLRRRRRRRRGRRGGAAAEAGSAASVVAPGVGPASPDVADTADAGETDDEIELEPAEESLPPVADGVPEEEAAPPPASVLPPLPPPPDQPSSPPDEPAPHTAEPPDPGPPDR
jgi:hypothetical protein